MQMKGYAIPLYFDWISQIATSTFTIFHTPAPASTSTPPCTPALRLVQQAADVFVAGSGHVAELGLAPVDLHGEAVVGVLMNIFRRCYTSILSDQVKARRFF